MSDISEKLQRAMVEKDISYGALSEATGIPKSALHRYINGDTEKVPIDRLETIASALGLSAPYLMGWDTNQDEVSDPEYVKLQELIKKAKEGNSTVYIMGSDGSRDAFEIDDKDLKLLKSMIKRLKENGN